VKTDVLIIGSGVAGLSLAIKLAEKRPDLRIVITSKTNYSDSNSNLAQGGVAAVMNAVEDSIESHIADTLKAGDGFCVPEVVEEVVKQGAARINDLMAWGWQPDTAPSRKLDLAREGGHSAYRVVHSKDQTGQSLISVLLAKVAEFKNVQTIENFFSLDLIMEADRCRGAAFLDLLTKELYTVHAVHTVLATGGAGQVYAVTTNPEVATGDGIAIAERAGAKIQSMEFVQFHPTALYIPEQKGKAFLISEAVRGHGALLKHADGERFMNRYDERGSLAPRDVVARAISQEKLRIKVPNVFLDCREMADFESEFPYINQQCLARGIDPKKEMIPVAPAAHYMCGGIATDLHARTSVSNLFAIGECAYTGLHGANRLASNSLLENVVFAHNCAEFLAPQQFREVDETKYHFEAGVLSEHEEPFYQNLESKIQQIMSANAGIVRRNDELKSALKNISAIENSLQEITPNLETLRVHFRCKNLLAVSKLILAQSIARKQNAGGFYKIDNIKKARNMVTGSV